MQVQLREYLLQLSVFAILSAFVLAYFSPVLISDSLVIPGEFPDAFSFTWNFWWASQYERLGGSFYWTNHLFHPFGSSLYLHSYVPLFTYLGSLFDTHPAASMLLACIVSFCLNCYAAYSLAFRITKDWLISFLFALTLGFHPYLVGHLWAGHLNIIILFPLILLFREILIFIESNNPKRFFLATFLCLSLLAWTNLYYLYFSLLLLLVVALCNLRTIFTHLRYSSLFIFTTSVVLVVRIYPIMSLSSLGEYSPNHKASIHSADILHYFLPTQTTALGFVDNSWLNSRLSLAEEGVYLGSFMVLCWLLFVVFKKGSALNNLTLGISALLFFLLSLGPQVHIGDNTLFPNYVFITLRAILPAFPSVPIRFGVVLILCVYIQVLKNVTNRKLLLGTLILTLIEFFPKPLPFYSLTNSKALIELKGDSSIKAVANCTPSLYEPLAQQLQHEKKVLGAFLARRPRKAESFYRSNKFLKAISSDREVPSNSLLNSFERLEIQAVVCSSKHVVGLTRLENIEFLTKRYEDEFYSVFTLKRP